jgi:hypothetical protein
MVSYNGGIKFFHVYPERTIIEIFVLQAMFPVNSHVAKLSVA